MHQRYAYRDWWSRE